MINTLEIENYKCFSDLRISFGALTLLTGFNAAGKSSAIQPLLLLAQGLRDSPSGMSFPLNGSLVRLGTMGDVVPSDTTRSSIRFQVADTNEEVSWKVSASAGDRSLKVVDSVLRPLNPSSDVTPRPPILEDAILQILTGMSYISAVREGTADAYPMPESEHTHVDVGVDGRFAAYWYGKYADDEVAPERAHRGESALSLRKQLDMWLATLFPGAQANVQHVPQLSLESLQFRVSDIGTWRRPANVGYGFTYAFPIIVALLAAPKGQIVVIDSPEAHLHPFAQSQMGRLLAHFASAGIQVIVETHSDHLLNGVRLAVKDAALAASQLRIHFFRGASASGHGVISPSIDLDGRIGDWPEGFFDQAEKDLARLSGWE
jgi:predicted ATPase